MSPAPDFRAQLLEDVEAAERNRHRGVRLDRLAELGHDRASASRALNRMAALGWVAKIPHHKPQNPRWRITPAGLEALRAGEHRQRRGGATGCAHPPRPEVVRLWTAMRVAQTFSVRDLVQVVILAEQPDIEARRVRRLAQRFVRALADAGILAHARCHDGRARRWRLAQDPGRDVPPVRYWRTGARRDGGAA